MMNDMGIHAIEPEELRVIMRRWSSGVTIISAGDEEHAHGMTASSFTSVSLDPPLILISIRQSNRTAEWIQRTGRFAVTILGADLQQLADRFAGRSQQESERFDGVPTLNTPSGLPFPENGLATIECQLDSQIEAGTHLIMLGLVTWSSVRELSAPLLYFNQGYRQLDLE